MLYQYFLDTIAFSNLNKYDIRSLKLLCHQMNWFNRLKIGLSNSSSSISTNINQLFTHQKLDSQVLEELEELLIISDMGVQVASEIIQQLKKDKFDKKITEKEIKQFLTQKIISILDPVTAKFAITHKPHVLLICGVNGSGKTTSIGKLALKFQQENYKVMIAACDTFRAAALEQLTIWAERANCPIIKSTEKQDPASVAYQAFQEAKSKSIDVLLIDTAGRLHNQVNLMEELSKCVRVIQKIDPTAPHNTILVLDATTGQNALNQVDAFKKLSNIDGLIITKLDGSARGGIVVAIAKKYNIPIYAIGVGEDVSDLNSFSASEFASALVSNN